MNKDNHTGALSFQLLYVNVGLPCIYVGLPWSTYLFRLVDMEAGAPDKDNMYRTQMHKRGHERGRDGVGVQEAKWKKERDMHEEERALAEGSLPPMPAEDVSQRWSQSEYARESALCMTTKPFRKQPRTAS